MCAVCWTDHTADEPHRPTSLWWANTRRSAGQPDASWLDALAHVHGEARARWVHKLADRGENIAAPSGAMPILDLIGVPIDDETAAALSDDPAVRIDP